MLECVGVALHPICLCVHMCVAVCCSVLQCVVVCCSVLQWRYIKCVIDVSVYRYLDYVIMCYSVMQFVAVCVAMVLHPICLCVHMCVAVRHSVLQCLSTACCSVRCSALQ